jgi:hypothetical protein
LRGICEIVIAVASVLMTLAAVALADRPAMALLSGARVVLVPYASGSGAILPPQIRTATRSPGAGR